MIGKELVAASSRPLLLSVLAEGESYGYQILQNIRNLSGGTIQWSEGMLYPVLHRLEREGLISSEWKTSETGRDRKYYSLSSKGRKALNSERQQWLTVHNSLCALWKLNPLST